MGQYDELSSQGKARPPDLQVHKRISTHIQQLLELKAEGKLTGDQGSRGRLGGAPKSRFKMGGGADVVEEGVDVMVDKDGRNDSLLKVKSQKSKLFSKRSLFSI